MRMPEIGCPCGRSLKLAIIEEDTHDYEGRIWQAGCRCGRSWTVEVANAPDYKARKPSKA